MVIVALLDPASRKYKQRADALGTWLLRQSENENRALEIFIVGDNQLPKNVLAFPADTSFPRPDLSEKPLGEIYINPQYIAAHNENFDYMLVHGFLHLLGYDHIKKSDRMVMERKEQELLKRFEAH